MNTNHLCFLLIAVALGSSTPIVSAQQRTQETDKVEMSEQQVNEKDADRQITFWCEISEGGHRASLVASNTNNVGYNCTANCFLKTSNGSHKLQGSAFLPAKANKHRFLTHYASNIKFVSITDPGTHNCK